MEIDTRLSLDDTYVVYVQMTFINRYVNFPAQIDLSEDQKFEYEDSKKFVSPYSTREFSSTYKFQKIM